MLILGKKSQNFILWDDTDAAANEDSELQRSPDIEHIVDYMTSEMPEKAQEIIHRFEANKSFEDIIAVMITGGPTTFVSYLKDAYLANSDMSSSFEDEYDND